MAADPISIIGAVQAAFSLANALKDYVNAARGAKGDLLSLISEIETTFRNVKILEELIQQNEKTPRWSDYGLACAKSCVEKSNFMLTKLCELFLKSGVTLDSENVHQSISPSLTNALWWPMYKPQLRELKDELVLLKLDISTAHTTWNSSSW